MSMGNVKLLCDSHHGVYLPHVWVKNTENIWNIKQEDWDYLSDASNVEDEHYRDTWHDILSDAVYTDSNGVVWTLYQDGDLFAVAYNEMTEEDKEIFWR